MQLVVKRDVKRKKEKSYNPVTRKRIKSCCEVEKGRVNILSPLQGVMGRVTVAAVEGEGGVVEGERTSNRVPRVGKNKS